LTGKWTGALSSGMDYGMDSGKYSRWHHCVLDFTEVISSVTSVPKGMDNLHCTTIYKRACCP